MNMKRKLIFILLIWCTICVNASPSLLQKLFADAADRTAAIRIIEQERHAALYTAKKNRNKSTRLKLKLLGVSYQQHD